jgi:hypothetical protein
VPRHPDGDAIGQRQRPGQRNDRVDVHAQRATVPVDRPQVPDAQPEQAGRVLGAELQQRRPDLPVLGRLYRDLQHDRAFQITRSTRVSSSTDSRPTAIHLGRPAPRTADSGARAACRARPTVLIASVAVKAGGCSTSKNSMFSSSANAGSRRFMMNSRTSINVSMTERSRTTGAAQLVRKTTSNRALPTSARGARCM